tara:strand:+ start:38 stop:571 length:534 start_codon:yes stop_codon:yes gene_type:complete
MKLTLIRHLPTESNKKNILQGSIDNKLCAISKEDIKSIENNIKKLSKEKFNIILTSSMIRTIETARAYGYRNFVVESLSNEINFGLFEGYNKNKLINKYKYEWYNDMRKIPIGEKFEEFSNRVFSFIKKYQNHSHLLLFGHGAFLRGLIAYSKSIPLEKMNNICIEHNQLMTIKINE